MSAKLKRYSFLAHRKRIRIEGFDPHKLITECIRKRIQLKRLICVDETSIEATLTEKDYIKLKKLAGSKYRIIVIESKGYSIALKYIWKRKISILGAILFCFLIVYQSCFVAEIQIKGYESISEMEIRQTLAKAGLFEGAKIEKNTSKLKKAMFEMSDDLAYISVKYKGRKAIVDIVEAEYKKVKEVEKDTPCNIVSDFDCYVDEIKISKGARNAEKGQFVKKGDILISGKVPIESTAYGTPDEKIKEYYVHAAGEAMGIMPYEYVFHEEKVKHVKERTGKRLPFLELRLGDLRISTKSLALSFKYSQVKTKKVAKFKKVPFEFSVGTVREVTIKKKKRSKGEIVKSAERKLRNVMEKKLPKDAQILNKSLKFSSEENIIDVYIQLEVRHKIGKEEEITISDTKHKQ